MNAATETTHLARLSARCLRCGATVAWTTPEECARRIHGHQVACGGAQTFVFE